MLQDATPGHLQPGSGRAPVDENVIREAVDAVFERSAYNSATLMDRLILWLADVLQSLFAALRPLFMSVRESSVLSWTVLVVVALLLASIIGRIVYVAHLRRVAAATSPLRFASSWVRGGEDPLALAERAARDGRFTEAAHALYLALLETIARQHRIKLHPSKTVGDYARELRARGSSLFARFRDFARSYETVIYGVGHCDRERYERLHDLAAPILRANG